jgi:hypothetical protein
LAFFWKYSRKLKKWGKFFGTTKGKKGHVPRLKAGSCPWRPSHAKLYLPATFGLLAAVLFGEKEGGLQNLQKRL